MELWEKKRKSKKGGEDIVRKKEEAEETAGKDNGINRLRAAIRAYRPIHPSSLIPRGSTSIMRAAGDFSAPALAGN